MERFRNYFRLITQTGCGLFNLDRFYRAVSHAMNQRTKWNVVATAVCLLVLAMLLLFGVSWGNPCSVRIGKANFGAGTMEGRTLAPGHIMDGAVEKYPTQNVYKWYVKTDKRTLLVFSFTWI